MLDILPTPKKTVKERTPIAKKNRRVKIWIATRVQPLDRSFEVKVVEIEAIMVDKVVSSALVDGSNGPIFYQHKLWKIWVLI